MRLQTLAPLALGLTIAAFNTACSVDTASSRDVKPSAIHQSYSLDYQEDTNQTYLSAQFRVGGPTGTTVELESPSSLDINGYTPSKSSILGTSYSLQLNGFMQTGIFNYVNDDEQRLVNSISIDRINLIEADPTVSVIHGYVVNVQAVRLGTNEDVSVELTQDQRGSDGTFDYASATGVFDPARGQAVFTPAELEKLSNGTATLKIVRHKWGALQASMREGGTMNASYSVRPLTVNVVDNPGPFVPAAVQPLARN